VITRLAVWRIPTIAMTISRDATAINHHTSVSTAITTSGSARNSPTIASVEMSGRIE
jgi:hypothetical protein